MLKLVGSLKVLDVLKINPSSLAIWARKSTGIMKSLLSKWASAKVLHLTRCSSERTAVTATIDVNRHHEFGQVGKRKKGGNIIFPPFFTFPTWQNSWCQFTSSVTVTAVRPELKYLICRAVASLQLLRHIHDSCTFFCSDCKGGYGHFRFIMNLQRSNQFQHNNFWKSCLSET